MRIPLLRPGTFQAQNGPVTLTAADLAAIAAGYDAGRHEAPIVVGHPRTDDPAYGWVKSLRLAEDGTLEAEADDVDQGFADLVRAGRYRKVSAALYRPDDANHPRPGVWALRHVGFLGAQPPAVKGLRPVQLGEADEATIIELSESDWAYAIRAVATSFAALRDFLIDDKGLDIADRVLPAWSIDTLREAASRPAMEPDATPSFSEEQGMDPTLAEREQALAVREADLASRAQALDARSEELAKAARDMRARGHQATAEALLADGRITPAELPTVVTLLGVLDGDGVELAEGQETPATQLAKLLRGLPARIDLAERVRGGDALDAEDPQAVARAAEAWRAEQQSLGVIVGYAEAVRHVTGSRAA
ncbi:MAG: hypothetical protein U1E45_14985 [Geminicoccaceae bacterium]